jgi:hypothetical protein
LPLNAEPGRPFYRHAMMTRLAARIAANAAALAVTAALMSGCAGCHKNQCPVNDPFCNDPNMGSIWLFAYNATETTEILAKLRQDKGLIAVSYTVTPDGRKQLEIVDNCQVTGTYSWERSPTTDLKLVMHSEDEAKAMLPVSFGAFSAAFKSSSVVEIKYKSPGNFLASNDPVSVNGDCSQATHIIRSIAVGAYETHVGSETAWNAGATGPAGVGNVGAGSSDGSDQRVNAGSFGACESGDSTLAGAPEQCAQPLRIKLTEIKKLAQNVESCNDDAFMAQGHGYAFDGKVFTVTSAQLGRIDEDIRADFTCGEDLSDAETAAIGEIMSFLDQNPSVKAHISVRCAPLMFGGSPSLHANGVRGLVGKYVSAGKITIDACLPMMGAFAGASGVYVELTNGCKEGSVGPNQFACMPQ